MSLEDLKFKFHDLLWDVSHFCRQPGVVITVLISTVLTYGFFQPVITSLDSLEVFCLILIWSGICLAVYVFGYIIYLGGDHWPSLNYSKQDNLQPKSEEAFDNEEFPTPDDVDAFVKSLPLKR